MDFFAQLIFYGVFWAIGVAVLYLCSLGRIVPTKQGVNGTYERLPTGKIVVKADLVAGATLVLSARASPPSVMISTAGRLAPADVRDELTAPTSPVQAREHVPAPGRQR